jgi:replicative DNA helicase
MGRPLINEMDIELTEADFSEPENKEILRIINKLYKDTHAEIDLITIVNEFSKEGIKIMKNVTVPFLIIDKQNNIDRGSDVSYWVRALKEANLANKIKTIGSKLVSNNNLDAVFTDVDNIIKTYNGFAIEIQSMQHISKLVELAAKKAISVNENEKNKNVIFSGFHEFDNILEGFNKGELTLIGARPGMGKTAVALEMTKKLAKNNIRCAYFILESTGIQIASRLLLSELNMSSYVYKFKTKTDEQANDIFEANVRLSNLPIWIDDDYSLTTQKLRAKIKQLKIQQNIDVVIVDYLQLMSPNNTYKGNKVNEVSEISRELVNIAKEFNVALIALSQLNRGVESRGEKKPQIADLRDSGSLEQDAAKIIFLYRAAYYVTKEDPNIRILPEDMHIELIVAKNRDAGLGSALLYHNRYINQFFTQQMDDDFLPDYNKNNNNEFNAPF